MAEILKDTTANKIGTGDGGLSLDPSGTEVVTISNGIMLPDGTKSEPSVRFTDDSNTGIYSPTNDQIALTGQGEDALLVTGVASSVNVLEVKPSTTTNPLELNATGTDTDISVNVVPKGTGTLKVDGTDVSLSGHTHGDLYYTESEVDTLLGGKSDTSHNHTGVYEPANANIQSHISSTSNPHSVTADQVLPTQTGNSGKYLTTDGTNSSWATVSGGSSDHGTLTGLSDDDHTQYALADGTRGDFAASSHTHSYLPLSGGNITGAVDMGTRKITNLATPTVSTDAANASYVNAARDTRIEKAIIDAKGDLIVGTASDTYDNLGVGTDGQVLTADSTQTMGVKWATPSGGSSALDDLTDVVITSVSDGQVLTYDSGTGNWVNETPSGGGGSDPRVVTKPDPVSVVPTISTSASPSYSLAVGDGANALSLQTTSTRATAVGHNAVAGNFGSTCLGSFDNTTSYGARGGNDVAIGKNCLSSGGSGVAVGYESSTTGGTAVGPQARVSGPGAVNIGSNQIISHEYSVAIGSLARSCQPRHVHITGSYLPFTSPPYHPYAAWFDMSGRTASGYDPIYLDSGNGVNQTIPSVMGTNRVGYCESSVVAKQTSSGTGSSDFKIWKFTYIVVKDSTGTATIQDLTKTVVGSRGSVSTWDCNIHDEATETRGGTWGFHCTSGTGGAITIFWHGRTNIISVYGD